jgi:hypothetical protein
MTRTRKIFTATIAAVTLGLTIASTSTPAAAWGHRYYGHGGHGGGAIAAGLIGGLAVGAIAASAANDYYSCVGRVPVYNSWGEIVGYRRARVAC